VAKERKGNMDISPLEANIIKKQIFPLLLSYNTLNYIKYINLLVYNETYVVIG